MSTSMARRKRKTALSGYTRKGRGRRDGSKKGHRKGCFGKSKAEKKYG